MAHLLLGSSRLSATGNTRPGAQRTEGQHSLPYLPARPGATVPDSQYPDSLTTSGLRSTIYHSPGSTEPHPFANPVSPRLAQCSNQSYTHCTLSFDPPVQSLLFSLSFSPRTSCSGKNQCLDSSPSPQTTVPYPQNGIGPNSHIFMILKVPYQYRHRRNPLQLLLLQLLPLQLPTPLPPLPPLQLQPRLCPPPNPPMVAIVISPKS